MYSIPVEEENDSSFPNRQSVGFRYLRTNNDHYRDGRLLRAFVIFRFVLSCSLPASITTQLHRRQLLFRPRASSCGMMLSYVSDSVRLWGSQKVSRSSSEGCFHFFVHIWTMWTMLPMESPSGEGPWTWTVATRKPVNKRQGVNCFTGWQILQL